MTEVPKSPTNSNTQTGPGGPESTGGSGGKKGDTVVIAMDGSEYSEYALQFYKDNVHKPGNHVIIVHSTEYKTISFPAVAVMGGNTDMTMMTKEIEAEEMKSNAFVEKLTQQMDNLKIDGEIARIHGEAGPAILTVAHEKHADYIVIGCRGKGSVRRTFTGSVTDYVSHHAEVPVMIARHKDHLKHHHGFHLHNPFHHHKKHAEKSHT
ncbi:universal stress protein Slr1101-like [Ruditapes philippinarum]|uniref:universal stress protein Slr1101-like n=1 Tax=Ruditapes philippinarum TaxID=129788 RepID=UPI00295AA588|nr:universal stress protein Slr1101-like [Ruditapes philippinarum]